MNEKLKSGINKAYWYEQRQTLGSNKMRIKHYLKYKDSGINWIGKIPEGWEVKRVKHICSRNAEYGLNEPSDNYVEEGARFLRTTDITENGNLIKNGVYLPENKTNREYLLNTSDVLVARSGSVGISLYFDKEKYGRCLFAGYLVRFVVNKSNSGRFLYYFTNSKSFYAQIELGTIQTTIGNFNGQKYANMRIAVSPLPDQTAIANFLDKKTARIDAMIEKDKRLIALLKEKRTALINNCVTKGLDPNVKLKDSGIEGIGEIPEGWEVHKLKYRTIINKKKLEDDINPNYVINYVDISNVDSSGNILDIEEQIFEDAPSRARRIPRSGDTIISTVRTYLKAIAYLENIPGNLIVSTGFAVLEPIKSINSKYLFYSTSSEVFIQNVIAYSKGVAYPAINPPELGQIPIIMPSLPEQTTIVNFLDKATAKIDKTIQKIEQKINLLEEYKKSLINHVVTGKVDVREAVV